MTDYGPQDTSTTTLGANQFPIAENWTPNAGFSAVEGGTQTTDAGGKKSAPVRIEVKDGSDLTQGLTTDAAVTGDNPGTLSAKLRGLTKILTDIWDSVNHRIKVDGSGVTQPVSGTFWQATQPVSGTVTANAGTNLNTSALALESGGHLANIDTHTPAQGQATKANSSPVVLASDQGDLLVKGDFAEIAGQAAGSVTSTSTDLIPSTDMSGYSFAILQLSGTWTMTLQAQWSNDNFATAPVAGETGTIGASGPSTSITTNGMYVLPKYGRFLRIRPSAFTSNASCVGTLECYTQISPQLLSFVFASQSGTWTVQPGNTANTTPWLVTANAPASATATLANVGGSVSSVALQASNANRKGWYCFNDSTSALYINFGATASATAFTVKVPGGGFFEMPTSPIYTGAINGIWDTATGSARVTELT